MKKNQFNLLVVLLLVLMMSCLAAAKTSIKVSTWGDFALRKTWMDLINSFQKKYPDIEVKLQHSSLAEYFTKLQITTAGGVAPDVIEMSSTNLAYWADKDIFLDLKPFIDKDKEIDINDFYPAMLKGSRYKNKLYVLPHNAASPVALYYNQNLFKTYGLARPDNSWDWNDLTKAAQKMTVDKNHDKKNDIWGCLILLDLFHPFVWSNGGGLVDDEGEKLLVGEKATGQAFKWMFDLVGKYKCMPSMAAQGAIGQVPWYMLFNTGKIGMYANGRWGVTMAREIKDFDWDVAPLPKSPYTGKRANYIDMQTFGIYSKSKNKEAAWTFIKYVVSKRGQEAFVPSGAGIPSLKSVGGSDLFLKTVPPKSNKVFIDELEHSRVTPMILEYQELLAVFMQTVATARDGDTTWEEVLPLMEERMTKVLRRSK